MKNVMKTMMVVGVFALFAFAPVNETKTVVASTLEPVEEVCLEEEAIYCSVTVGDVTTSCWFCNCSKLAKTMMSIQ